MPYPEIFRVRQHFARPVVDHIPETVQAELSTLALHDRVSPGQSVAITVVSRASYGHHRWQPGHREHSHHY